MHKPATEIDLAAELAELLSGPCEGLPEPIRGLMRKSFLAGVKAAFNAVTDDQAKLQLLYQVAALLPPA